MTRKLLALLFQKSVPMSALRHDDRPLYVAEGYGAKPLDEWPVVGFFQTWVSGDHSRATETFCHWYADQFRRYGTAPKSDGGMHGGSLYRLVEQIHGDNGKTFDPEAGVFDEDLLTLAIRTRVGQRFEFLQGVSVNGFVASLSVPPIIGLKHGGEVTLRGGHHRAAALMALGEQQMPGIYVIPRWSEPLVGRILRRFG